MELSTIIPHIEALIFASDKPLTALEITEYVNNALGFIEDRASLDQVESSIDGIKEEEWFLNILRYIFIAVNGIVMLFILGVSYENLLKK